MQMMRSWMFVPGHQQKMIDKALDLKLDVVMFDLEDGVPPAQKEVARSLVAKTLESREGGPVRFVRIHAAGSGNMTEDLRAVVQPGLGGLTLPKVESPEHVLSVDTILSERERRAGLKSGSVRLLATIESARGLIQAPTIAGCCPRLVGLMFGAEDFALDLGLSATPEGEAGNMLYARSALVVAAASERLQVVDRVYLDIKHPDGLREDARFGRDLGFTGKALIHPGQIEIVHDVFRPTEAEIEHAQRVIAAFEASHGETVAVDGKMVDLPVVERARRVLMLRSQ